LQERLSKTGQPYYFDKRYKKISWKKPVDADALLYVEDRVVMRTLEYDPRPDPETEEEETDDDDITDDEVDEATRDELVLLREKLKESVESEDFEEAARLKSLVQEKESFQAEKKEAAKLARKEVKDALKVRAKKVKELQTQLAAAIKGEDYLEAARIKKLIAEETETVPASKWDQGPDHALPVASDDVEEEVESDASEEEGVRDVVPPPPMAALAAVEEQVKREALRDKVKERMKRVLAEDEDSRGRHRSRSRSPRSRDRSRSRHRRRRRSRSRSRDRNNRRG